MSTNTTTNQTTTTSSTGGSSISQSSQMRRSTNTANGTATLTITENATTPQNQQNEEVLRLTLQPRPSVTWDNDVVDNEGLGRKSSKRCCIFHKQR